MKPKILISVLLTLGIVSITTDKNNQEKENQIQISSIEYDANSEKEKITLVEAKADSSKRQEYLDTIVSLTKIPYCSGIVYDHDGSKIMEYTKQDLIAQNLDKKTIDFILNTRKQQLIEMPYLAITPQPYFTRGEKEYGTIFIGPDLFKPNAHQIDADYKATIMHEARHLEQHAKGLPFDYIFDNEIKEFMETGNLRIDRFEMVGELDAYHHILERIQNGEFLVSEKYLISITYKYNSLRKSIEENVISSNSSLEKVFLKEALGTMKNL